ncbi:MAG: OmpA family protein [Myxococcaceae bacterium]
MLDADGDGVLDKVDECPDVAEESGGDGDGCPDAPQIVLESGKIAIRGKLLFDLNSSDLLAKNAKLLDSLAALLKQHAELKHVLIEGHTDDTGTETFNQQLSVQRSERVKQALITRGIEAQRLGIKGWGKSKPMAPNDSEASRARNRRVEFVLGE